MGARGDLRGALIAALVCAGCLDFVEPTLPALGAPAVLQVDVRVDERAIRIAATLDPGFDEEGFRRSVPGEALTINGLAYLPVDTLPDGALSYASTDSLPGGALDGPFLMLAPGVAGVAAATPSLAWAGLARIGEDTVRLTRGEDLVLRVRTSGGFAATSTRHWLLTVRGDSLGSLLGGDGEPPDSIVLPARYVPAGDTLNARLSWSLSALVEPPPGDYVAVVAGDSRVNWTVIVGDAAGSAK